MGESYEQTKVIPQRYWTNGRVSEIFQPPNRASIQAALKHKNPKTTDIYLESLDDKSLDEKFAMVYNSTEKGNYQ